VRGGDFGGAVTFAVDLIGGVAVVSAPIAPRPKQASRDDRDDERKRRAMALRIWNDAHSIVGTLAEIYLTRERKIDITALPDIDDVLRFDPHCAFGQGERFRCLIALMRDVGSDEPLGIIRTAISTCGEKLERKMLGRKAGAAVKLWPDAAVTTGLTVGEGVETVAAAATRMTHRGTVLQPAWALCDAGNLADFAPMPGVEALTILTDHDTGRAGENAAEACARRWVATGRQVELLVPHQVGADFADLAPKVLQ
jgi:hypothetical protein